MSSFPPSPPAPDAIHPTRHPEAESGGQELSGAEMSQSRLSRRVTSHHNTFQTSCSTSTDEPPAYTIASRPLPVSRQNGTGSGDTLPKYTCTVAAQGSVLVQLESVNPLHGVSENEWKEVYMVLRGTLLSFHRRKGDGPGKLLRSYTLQHAEVGLASDSQHSVLVPRTKIANMIPQSVRRKAWQKDKTLYTPVRQHILRLRAELDQILIADSSEKGIHDLVNALGAAIDISPALDERSIPRQCTVPRRRRRQRTQPTGDLSDPALIAEQERLLRNMYPAFAENDQQSPPTRPVSVVANEESSNEPAQTAAREDDEIDVAAIREDGDSVSPLRSSRHDRSGARPTVSRQTTGSSVNSTFSPDMMFSTPSSNFDESGKWRPPHHRTPQQIQRYAKRCMPVLLANAPRPNDILMCRGRRVKINWDMAFLEDWELAPPRYASHGFAHGAGLERSNSSSKASASSASAAANRDAARVRDSMISTTSMDEIMPLESSLPNLHQVKSTTSTLDKSTTRLSLTAQGSPDFKNGRVQSTLATHPEIHGMVLCF